MKEELGQLSNLFKLTEYINQEMIELDDTNYTEELWFTDIDEKVFSFKHEICNWLKEPKQPHSASGNTEQATPSARSTK